MTGRLPSANEIREDMALVAPLTSAVRTYSACEFGDAVPRSAARYGLKVWLGVWIGPDEQRNRREIACGIMLARRYPLVVERLIIGNEVLLRREISVTELTGFLDEARKAIKQPVDYADVRQIWERFPVIADHVDDIMVHLLPYWDDLPNPGDPSREAATAISIVDRLKNRFPGRPLIVGEVGWPSFGRQRGALPASRYFQTVFLRDFGELARRRDIRYNVVEAIDQDWKAWHEGAVGANWGLFDQARRPKVSPGGFVSEDVDWIEHGLASVAVAGLGMVVTSALGRRYGVRPAHWPPIAMATAFFLATVCGFCAPALWRTAYTSTDMILLPFCVFGQLVLAGLIALAVGSPSNTELARDARIGLGLAVAGALITQIGMVFDPSHREFPYNGFLVPAAATLVLIACRMNAILPRTSSDAVLSILLVCASLKVAFGEGLTNGQSILWCAIALIIASPGLFALALIWPRTMKSVRFAPSVIGVATIISLHLYRAIYVDDEATSQHCLTDPSAPACQLRAGLMAVQAWEALGWISLMIAAWAAITGRRNIARLAIFSGCAAIVNWNANEGAIAFVIGCSIASRRSVSGISSARQ